MTLKTLFAIPITVILVVTLSLAGMLAGQGWSGLARGRQAAAAVERIELLLTLQGDLTAERIATNVALSAPLLTSERMRPLRNAREETDGRIFALIANIDADAKHPGRPAAGLIQLLYRLGVARAATDTLLSRAPSERSHQGLGALMPTMLVPQHEMERWLSLATLDIIKAEPDMAGLLTVGRIATTLRDQLSGIAGLMMPRFNKGERMTDAEIAEADRFLATASQLTGLLARTVEIANPTGRMRRAVAELMRFDDSGALLGLNQLMATGPVGEDGSFRQPQRMLIPWGEHISTLRTAILDATVGRVAGEQRAREHRLHVVMVAFGAVLIAVLESVALLSHRVVSPLAQLGLAITRIAAGERKVPLNIQSGTREIIDMATAVETLREAALVADAAAMRQRLAARQRLLMLREALGIAQSVQEPARALERDVARLSEGIDAAIALVTSVTNRTPETLGAAAAAVRSGLEDMRRSAAGLDATFAAASGAQNEDRPPEEFVAYISAVCDAVSRREIAVRAFVQPSLVALRDAVGAAPASGLRDLVSDQFLRIETTVATVASMRDAMTRATSIVRELSLEEAPLAA